MSLPLTALAFAGGIIWGISALVMALPRGRVPSGYSFLYSLVGTVGILIGLTEWVPAWADAELLTVACAIYFFTPIVFTAWAFIHYEPGEGSRENPRTIS